MEISDGRQDCQDRASRSGSSSSEEDQRRTCSCRSHNGFLTAKGLEEAAQRRDAIREVDAMDESLYLDKVGSVSALDPDPGTLWLPGPLIDQQYRRFLDGS